jgi:natural product precursor
MKSLKLNAISNEQLNKKEMSKILGGAVRCGCICAGTDNDNANASSNHNASNKPKQKENE